jgi:hypothetical protein
MSNGSIHGLTGGLMSPLLDTSVLPDALPPELLPPSLPPEPNAVAIIPAPPAANPNLNASLLFIVLSFL